MGLASNYCSLATSQIYEYRGKISKIAIIDLMLCNVVSTIATCVYLKIDKPTD